MTSILIQNILSICPTRQLRGYACMLALTSAATPTNCATLAQIYPPIDDSSTGGHSKHREGHPNGLHVSTLQGHCWIMAKFQVIGEMVHRRVMAH